MDVEITGRHIVITPAIRAYVMKRLRKFGKVLGDDSSFHVIIDAQKGLQTVDILLKTKSMKLAGKGETEDMYASIIKAIEKIERQALKHKGKIVEGKRRPVQTTSVGKKTGVGPKSARPEAGEAEGIQEEALHDKPMTVEEAAIELHQSALPFIVFRNVESGTVHVLYRKTDRSLGLIRT